LTASGGTAELRATGAGNNAQLTSVNNAVVVSAGAAMSFSAAASSTIAVSGGASNLTMSAGNAIVCTANGALNLTATTGAVTVTGSTGITLTPGTNLPVIVTSGMLRLVERTAGIAVAAGQMLLFCKDNAPNDPYCRDDTNVDRKILTSPASLADMATLAQGTAIGRARDAGTGVPVPLTENQQLENLSRATKRVREWDFEGAIDAGGVLSLPGWVAWNGPTISQRDSAAAEHSANHPGVLRMAQSTTLVDEKAVYIGPWDFSKVSRFGVSIKVPSNGGSELANCALGVGLVADPTDMDVVANARIWPAANPSVSLLVKSAGTGFGNWQIHSSGGTTAASFVGAVAVDTWYDIEARDEGSGTWRIYVGGVAGSSRSLVPTSGICYLALGMIRGAGAAGSLIDYDRVWIETAALDRSAA
jgi:hypothetical protein